MTDSMNFFARAIVALSFLVLVVGARADERKEVSSETMECGKLALYQLFKIENQQVSWEAVVSQLGEPPKDGHSMKELCDAARGLGLELAGVKWEMTKVPLDRPAIFFVKRRGSGHFFVVRPVGLSRKMVQILDGVRSPEVMDVADLEAIPGWTGLALLPTRTNWIKTITAVLLICVVIVTFVCIRVSGDRASKTGFLAE